MAFKPLDFFAIAAPLAAAVAATVVARHFIAPDVDLDAMTRGIAGPGTWPKVMLYGIALCAALILVRNAVELMRRTGSVGTEPESESEYDDVKLLLGIGVLIAYGAGIHFIGMAWATLAFVALWLVLGGFRRPLPVVLVSTIGTVLILYLFVKASAMPLNRGKGIFEQATIVLYRVLGIY